MLPTRALLTRRAGAVAVRRKGSPMSERSPNLRVSPTASITASMLTAHQAFAASYGKVMNETDKTEQQRHGDKFVWDLARHSLGEELVLYPALEKHLGSLGKRMVATDRKDQAQASQRGSSGAVWHGSNQRQIKELLVQFQSIKSSDPDYIPKLSSLWAKIEDHIVDEEAHDLPALEERLSLAASKSMAKKFEMMDKFAPSGTAPFDSVMGLLTAPVERLAEMFKAFTQQHTPIPQPAGYAKEITRVYG